MEWITKVLARAPRASHIMNVAARCVIQTDKLKKKPQISAQKRVSPFKQGPPSPHWRVYGMISLKLWAIDIEGEKSTADLTFFQARKRKG